MDTLTFKCSGCSTEFTMEYTYPKGILMVFVDSLKRLVGKGAVKQFNKEINKLKGEMEDHIRTQHPNTKSHHFNPVNPPKWLIYKCNKCEWHTTIGEKTVQQLVDIIHIHAANKHAGQQVVIEPHMSYKS